MRSGQWVHILQMALTAPGRELYLEAGRLKEKPERVRAILLILLLPILGVLLWSIRKNIYVLIFGGGSMAVGFFYIYFTLYERRMKILDFMARLFEPFYKVFEKHRKAAGWGSIREENNADTGKTGAAAGGSTAGKAAGEEKGREEDEYFRRWKDAAGRAKEARKREWEQRKRNYERRHAQNNAGDGKTKENYRRADNAARKPAADHAREEAETIFMVKYPYDEAEIKSKRNMLLKKYHPDNAEGSEEMCKKINECYAVLMKYCG